MAAGRICRSESGGRSRRAPAAAPRRVRPALPAAGRHGHRTTWGSRGGAPGPPRPRRGSPLKTAMARAAGVAVPHPAGSPVEEAERSRMAWEPAARPPAGRESAAARALGPPVPPRRCRQHKGACTPREGSGEGEGEEEGGAHASGAAPRAGARAAAEPRARPHRPPPTGARRGRAAVSGRAAPLRSSRPQPSPVPRAARGREPAGGCTKGSLQARAPRGAHADRHPDRHLSAWQRNRTHPDTAARCRGSLPGITPVTGRGSATPRSITCSFLFGGAAGTEGSALRVLTHRDVRGAQAPVCHGVCGPAFSGILTLSRISCPREQQPAFLFKLCPSEVFRRVAIFLCPISIFLPSQGKEA